MRQLKVRACKSFAAYAGLLLALGHMSGAATESNIMNPLPAPKNLGDPAKLGLGIQRTMTLLHASTPQHRDTVRILFYGQSITEQAWWKMVADDLRHRFPDANLVIENRALGGFSSQRLVKTAETDLYSFYPDLMIFHVYGAHTDYEDIIHRTRSRTTAEVLIQTDHITKDTDLNEPTDPAQLHPDGKIWNSFMNYRWLPTVAQRYGAALEDQRNLWKQYLRDTGLPAQQFLKDGVHPNLQGSWLLAQFANAYLTPRPTAHLDPMNCDTVHTVLVGQGVNWKDGRLQLAFEGNRLDVVLKPGTATAHVLIDAQRPSQIPQLYDFTRAVAHPGGKWPVILKMFSAKPLQLEDWTMQVSQDAADAKLFHFSVSGSKTGPDGAGRSDQKFVSNSEQIVIEPADWDVDFSLSLAGVKPIPATFTVNWKVVPFFQDEVVPPAVLDPTLESTVTVAQGLPNQQHTLEIDGGLDAPIAALRIYRPLVAEGPPSTGKL